MSWTLVSPLTPPPPWCPRRWFAPFWWFGISELQTPPLPFPAYCSYVHPVAAQPHGLRRGVPWQYAMRSRVLTFGCTQGARRDRHLLCTFANLRSYQMCFTRML